MARAGLDLMDGHAHSALVDRHRSREFVAFLKQLDAYYDTDHRIRVVLDNHSAHVSKETRAYLAAMPNRLEFIFTPKHGSWRNLVESFFGNMARTLLRGIRVSSKAELAERIQRYINRISQYPVIYCRKYKMEDTTIA